MSPTSLLNVDLAVLDRAEALYRSRGMAAGAVLGSRWAADPLPASAFGKLAQSRQLVAAHDRFHEQVRSDLHVFAQSLTAYADLLGTGSGAYRNVDSVNAAALSRIADTVR